MSCSIPLADWRAAGRYFTYRGNAVFFRDDGPRDAPTLLLIHGFPTASWDWEAVWPAFTSRFRTIALDMLGFGWSAKPYDHDYRIAEQADIHEALLRELRIDNYHVLAHDYGDTVAQELLARRIESPDAQPTLLSACFLNGGLFPETHRAAVVQKLLLSPVGPIVARLTGRRALARNLRRIFGPHTPPSAEHLAGFWTLMKHGGAPAALDSEHSPVPGQPRSDFRTVTNPREGHAPPATARPPASGSPRPGFWTATNATFRAATFRTLTNPRDGRAILPRLIRYIVERHECRARWVGALEHSPVPLKLICGASDPISGAHMAQRYCEIVPGADITLLDGIGHYPQLEAPVDVVRAFLRFHGAEGC